jgi:hypothetical protein
MERLEAFRGNIAERIAAVGDLRSLESLQSDILRHVSLFEGSPHAAELENSLTQCELLKRFFESINRQGGGSVMSPKDAKEKTDELSRLGGEYGSQISREQESVLSAAIANIVQLVHKQEQSASEWLNECEKSFESNKDLDELTKRLQSAPIFLSRIQMQRLGVRSLCRLSGLDKAA